MSIVLPFTSTGSIRGNLYRLCSLSVTRPPVAVSDMFSCVSATMFLLNQHLKATDKITTAIETYEKRW